MGQKVKKFGKNFGIFFGICRNFCTQGRKTTFVEKIFFANFFYASWRILPESIKFFPFIQKKLSQCNHHRVNGGQNRIRKSLQVLYFYDIYHGDIIVGAHFWSKFSSKHPLQKTDKNSTFSKESWYEFFQKKFQLFQSSITFWLEGAERWEKYML